MVDFTDLLDADIDVLLDGETPANTDLAAISGLISQLRSLADTPLSRGFIDSHVETAAIQRLDNVGASGRPPATERLAFGIRRRVSAAAASLVMLVSATGIAAASDSAAPGDWNYGIDMALEAIGIGAGGHAERLEELQQVSPEIQLDEPTPETAEASDERGLGRASEAVSQNPASNLHSVEARSRVSALLTYMNTVDRIDGAVVAAMARGESPGEAGRSPSADAPGRENRPDSPGQQGNRPGNPDKSPQKKPNSRP